MNEYGKAWVGQDATTRWRARVGTPIPGEAGRRPNTRQEQPMDELPEATVRPCNECPWRRESASGWLGPMDAEDWLTLVQSDYPIACHLTLVEDGTLEGASQCAGAAQFRKNTCKSPRDKRVAVAESVDTETVFARPAEFLAHHTRRSRA